ncbi:ATP-grasp peptide maturase system methyltransferase [Actinocorallia sp. API 0066]|uniref:ATP-grasp peptide maturase system methyltransferase n=1 Tax=Actinocorallia sp. API 0066 TaxID=2896846 RepID=UPI001E6401BC|nr:ATP-grasp peptide maturase system methyltransferase [Actinocorallia sp. API 0066]MCD0453710.1 ATP-grasp peptide maturase system methyltransferase [Actinocorallia sp. API 0066]
MAYIEDDSVEERARGLRARLVEELVEEGVLGDLGWRRAVGEVPRHWFVPGFFVAEGRDEGSGMVVWEGVTEKRDAERWLGAVYGDRTLVTQFDEVETDWDAAGRRVGGAPSSSSTLPSLVVRMWVDADVRDGHEVLEIGTGTGYSAALACARLGEDGDVVSVEVDPERARQAAAALNRCGYRLGLDVADGLYGYPPFAPYDRIVAACSVRTIPAAWLAQAKPGGKILTTLSGWLYGSGRVLLTVGEDGTAEGALLPGTISFMPARGHLPPWCGSPHRWARLLDGSPRAARHGPGRISATDEESFFGRFLAQLAVPTATSAEIDGTVYLLDPVDRAVAALTPEEGGWVVREGGPVRLWSRIERALGAWDDAGRPGPERFRMRVTPAQQTIGLPGVPELSFVLP